MVDSSRARDLLNPQLYRHNRHFQVRLVSAGTLACLKSSMFRLHHRAIFLSEALVDEYIGLEETGDGVWSLFFYDVLLGRLDERDYKVRG